MAHHRRRQAAPPAASLAARGAASAAPKSVAGSTRSSQLSLPRTFLLSSRTRGRQSAAMRWGFSTRASTAFLEPLAEETSSRSSVAAPPSGSLLSQGRAGVLSQSWSSLRSDSSALSAGLIPEEPYQACLLYTSYAADE